VKQVRAVIRGRVQGVWFRAWAVEEAQKRGLRGWVRNLRNGSVEALFAGEADRVDAMIAACREGPPLARVSGIDLVDAAGEIVPEGFDQRPTG